MPRVLLVDDDEGLTNVINDYLQAKGYVVVVHHSIAPARESVAKNEFDLLILDWDLPDGESGVDFCREYRENGGIAPVLMITGHSSMDDKELGFEYGADDYITKPFALRDLFARVKSVLRRATTYTAKAVEKAKTVESLDKGFMIAGKYRLDEAIGMGGMALVWKATDLSINRTVVIKMMHEHLVSEKDNLNRFDNECKMMAKVQHPNVVTIFDSGTLDGVMPFMVMEYIKGESLRSLIDERGAAPVHSAAAILSQVCAGLQEAHEAGVIHRDLKPENIVIQDRTYKLDSVKIVDFGIARLIDSKERFTKTGTVIGTLEYISPEQLRDEQVDERSDIYALGIILFEILTADLPLKARTLEGIVAQHLVGLPAMPSAKRNDIPKGSAADQIVAKCLQKKPEHRYQSATELMQALEVLLH